MQEQKGISSLQKFMVLEQQVSLLLLERHGASSDLLSKHFVKKSNSEITIKLRYVNK